MTTQVFPVNDVKAAVTPESAPRSQYRIVEEMMTRLPYTGAPKGEPKTIPVRWHFIAEPPAKFTTTTK